MTGKPRPGTSPQATADRLASRFPLLCRPRLTCPDLETRIAEVRAYADAAAEEEEPADRLYRACAAWNLAALIAADCGMPDLAADLCERQFRILQEAWPTVGRTAIASLQPLVNLARLTHRAGDPDGAYRELCSVDRAVQEGGSATVHGRSHSLDSFTATSQDRREAVSWLRVVLLEDGTRLLAATGQWAKAASHAALYGGAGKGLDGGRQARIIAHLQDGRADSARALIDSSRTTAPWERAVAACLRSYSNLRTRRLTVEDVEGMLDAVRYAWHSSAPDTVLFGIRLGLTAADLAAERHQEQADLLYAELVRDAAASGDAFSAREILRHEAARKRSAPADTRTAAALVRRAGLGLGRMPQPLLTVLTSVAEAAGPALAQALGTSQP